MTPTTDTPRKATTYLPDNDSREDIVDFARTLRQIEEYLLRETGTFAELVAPDGERRAIPTEVFRALEQVANALASGKGVTVAPYSLLLTTQEAADFLGISRPTLVKLLDGGEMDFEKRNRHRKVTLRALVEYQERSRHERRTAMEEFTSGSQALKTFYAPEATSSDRPDEASSTNGVAGDSPTKRHRKV
ncbi:MAG: helix-turn-helix domain-containing protein [Pseudolysinimonas sp.]|uniref:helix-turn-helix domain-containing protein n=1 Tax=Pseudolysinimonas sp. TaxID=2680009 RepID=UPI003265DD6C